MSEGKLLTVREVSQILDMTEKEVIDLAEQGKIAAYKVGGVYLRFKAEQVEEFKRRNVRISRLKDSFANYSFKDRLSDFLYFNDFYIFAILIISWMFVIILGG